MRQRLPIAWHTIKPVVASRVKEDRSCVVQPEPKLGFSSCSRPRCGRECFVVAGRCEAGNATARKCVTVGQDSRLTSELKGSGSRQSTPGQTAAGSKRRVGSRRVRDLWVMQSTPPWERGILGATRGKTAVILGGHAIARAVTARASRASAGYALCRCHSYRRRRQTGGTKRQKADIVPARTGQRPACQSLTTPS